MPSPLPFARAAIGCLRGPARRARQGAEACTRAVPTLASTLLGGVACAAEPVARRFAEPAAAQGSVPAPVSGLAQVTFSLALVLAAVFAAAWLLKRVRGFNGARQDETLRIVAERAVGPRERVVLLQVGERQVLVGVANGSVRTLLEVPAQEPRT